MTDDETPLAPWMRLVARYGGDAKTAREAVVVVRGVHVQIEKRDRQARSPYRALTRSGIPDWVTIAVAFYSERGGPVFEVREPTSFEGLLEMVGLLREVQLGDEEIDGLCVVRATDVDAMRRVWTEEARTRFKAMRNHARSVLSDGEKVWIEVVEESADLPLLVSMVELVAEIARAA